MNVSWHYSREVVFDLAERYVANISNEILVLVVACLLGGAWLWMVARRKELGRLLPVLTLGTCIAGLVWAWSLRWIGDDAFISFRYARNLLDGHGLVYNVGERVEGYTNFAWTLLIAGAGAFGFDLAQASVVLSLACFASTIALIVVLSARIAADARPVAFSLAAVVFAANYASASFGTSGLETMFCTFAVVLALERALAGAPFTAGLAGIVATMAHPDHALFYAALGVAMVLVGTPKATLSRYALPFLLVFIPYFIWRWSYYGYFFPNTFYAKSGGGWHVQQGARYLGLGALGLGLWGVFPLAIHEAYRRRGELVGCYALIVFPVYLVYVVKIGGDFMQGRLLVVLLPLMFVLAELWVRRMIARGQMKSAWVGVLVIAFCALPSRLIRPGEKLLNVADERTFYVLSSFAPIEVRSPSTKWARNLNAIFSDSEETPKIATGVVGILGYETGFYMVDIYGLLDPVVAHMPIRRRGRPGHEKRSSPGRIIELGTDLSDMSIYPPPFDRWTKVNIKPFPLFMPQYDHALVGRLNAGGKRRARAISRYLDRLQPSRDGAQRDCEHWFVESYYFSHNHDPRRRSILQERFSTAARAPSIGQLYLDENPKGWTKTAIETFDDSTGLSWTHTESTPTPLTTKARAGQHFVFGNEDRFLNTFGPEAGDEARVTATSSEFLVMGEALTFRVGGGRSKSLQVELLRDAEPVRSATGCDSDLMGRRVWDVADLRGESVQLRIRDAEDGSLGHLVVDTFEQWKRD